MKDIAEAIKERRAVIHRLQAELDTLERARALLDGGSVKELTPLTAVLSLGPSAPITGAKRKREHPRKGRFNPKSGVGHTVAILRESGVPTHLDDIIEGVKKRGLPVRKGSLGSTLAKLAKRGRLFYRTPAPNTFGLLEWESAKQVARG